MQKYLKAKIKALLVNREDLSIEDIAQQLELKLVDVLNFVAEFDDEVVPQMIRG